jgi:hypothetical protein
MSKKKNPFIAGTQKKNHALMWKVVKVIYELPVAKLEFFSYSMVRDALSLSASSLSAVEQKCVDNNLSSWLAMWANRGLLVMDHDSGRLRNRRYRRNTAFSDASSRVQPRRPPKPKPVVSNLDALVDEVVAHVRSRGKEEIGTSSIKYHFAGKGVDNVSVLRAINEAGSRGLLLKNYRGKSRRHKNRYWSVPDEVLEHVPFDTHVPDAREVAYLPWRAGGE